MASSGAFDANLGDTPVTDAEWIRLFEKAFKSMDDRLSQVVQLNSCREHWIQAEISLYAWYHQRVEIWTDHGFGHRRKADLYSEGAGNVPAMVAEVKCLGDWAQAKCLDGDWSVRSDIERLREIECPSRIFVLVIPEGVAGESTPVGVRLRKDEWAPNGMDLRLDSAFVRMWLV